MYVYVYIHLYPPHLSVSPWHSTVKASPSPFFISVISMDLLLFFSSGFQCTTVPSYSGVVIVLDMANGSPVDMPPTIGLVIFSLFWHLMVFQVHLVPTLHLPCYQSFLQRALVPFSGGGSRSGCQCGHCYWDDFASGLSSGQCRGIHAWIYIYVQV